MRDSSDLISNKQVRKVGGDNSPRLFSIARQYYDSVQAVRDYVDIHYMLSMSNMFLSPMPTEAWLDSFYSMILDYWKVGECFFANYGNNLVTCDPVDVRIAEGSAPIEGSYNFDIPDYWVNQYGVKPVFIQNKSSHFVIRGSPVAYNLILIVSRQVEAGIYPPVVSNISIGFGSKTAITETSKEIIQRITFFRNKLIKNFLDLWPQFSIEFKPILEADVIREASQRNFIR